MTAILTSRCQPANVQWLEYLFSVARQWEARLTDRGLYVEFGWRLRELREKAGLTQEALGRSIGLTRTSITNMEAGRQAVDLENLFSLAEALGISPEEMLMTSHNRQGTLESSLSGLPESGHVLRFLEKQAVRP